MPSPNIPLPPAVQPHELQYKILRERQIVERLGGQKPAAYSASQGRGSTRSDRLTEEAAQPSYEGGYNDTSSSRRYEPSNYRTSSSRNQTSTTNRSGVSISSSVALGKLNKLEEMLLEERKARQGAESMLLALQKERVAREDAMRQSQATRKQLDDLLVALRAVVQQPDDATNVRKLQSLIDTSRVDPSVFKRLKAEALAADGSSGADRFAKNGTSLAPPVDSKYSKKIAHATALPALGSQSGGSTRGSTRSDGAPRTFLDGMGHYERAKERERQQGKASRQTGGQ